MFSSLVCLDLGSAYVRLNMEGKITVDEPSLLVIDCSSHEVRAVGAKALESKDKSMPGFEAVYPAEGGKIHNFAAAEALIRHVLKKSLSFGSGVRFALPVNSGSADKICLDRLARLAGAKSVEFVPAPLAAAIGAGIDMKLPGGILIIDIGEYKTDIAVLSAGEVIVSGTVPCAGRCFDREISRALRSLCRIQASAKVISEVKHNIVSAVPFSGTKKIQVSGLDLISGTACEREVSSEELISVLEEPLAEIYQGTAEVLLNTPCELSADLCDNGAVIVGGGANIFGICQYFQERLGIPVKAADNPQYCTALGCSSVASVKAVRAGER